MRCPVPYALLALFGWGVADALLASVRARLGRARTVLAIAREVGRAVGH